MTPWLSDPDVDIHVGDALDVLRGLPDGSVDCCVTSPPYWGLRDYGTGSWAGGSADCDHLGAPFRTKSKINANCGTGADVKNAEDREPMGQTCGKCSAHRVDRQLGLEATPDLYVAAMVAVFAEVRRVLADHGTLWLNIGDSYAANRTYQVSDSKHLAHDFGGSNASSVPDGLKPKDLCGIPWRLAFALQADGWWLRSDIIWAKPNPMPESVTDRPTKAHEYVFLLSKRPSYWFDAEAVREEYAPKTLTHRGGGKAAGKVGQQDATGKVASGNFGEWDKPRTAYPPPRPQAETLDGSDGEAPRGPDGRRATHVRSGNGAIGLKGVSERERWAHAGRNVRSVWEIATQPYPEAHFATFPEELPRRAILAGCPEWVCGVCGKARERIVKVEQVPDKSGGTVADRQFAADPRDSGKVRGWGEQRTRREVETLGWSDCGHDAYRPGTVLDPFLGSGTTAHVARKHGRRCVGIELNETYAQLAARRLQQLSLLADGSSY